MEQKGGGNNNGNNLDMGYEIINSRAKEDLFEEIKNGLRNNSVGYSPSVNSLRMASETIEEDATIEFLKETLKQLVNVLLMQFPSKLNQNMKNCIERSLLYSTEIIVKLIPSDNEEIQMVAFESLALVFDKSREYYSGQRNVYRQSLGAPEVHARCIKHFNDCQGFTVVYKALKDREWPGAENMKVLLEMCGNADPESAGVVKDICYLTIEKVSALTSELLKKEDMDQMDSVVKCVNNLLRRILKENFDPSVPFEFWLKLTGMFLNCGSFPQRLHAIDQIEMLNRHARRMRKPPFGFRLEGAGVPFVNGEYAREGMHKGAPMWKHQVDKPEKGEPSIVTLFRCEMREGAKVWFLSWADENSPGSDKDVDYYSAKNPEILPPMTGWGKAAKGSDPTPTILEIRNDDADEDTGDSLEQKMLLWVREMQFVEEIFGDGIHKEIVSRCEPLFRFLVDTNALKMEDLRFIWEKSLKTTNEELELAIKNILASVAKYISAQLLIPFLQMVQKTGETNYEAALAFAKQLAVGNNFNNNNIRVLLQKGLKTTKALLDFLWSLLHNPASYATGADKDILALLEQALSQQRGKKFRDAYAAQCIRNIQMAMETASKSEGEDMNQRLLRVFTIMLRLVLGYTTGEPLLKLWNDRGTNLKVLLFDELKVMQGKSKEISSRGRYKRYLRIRLDLIRALNGKDDGPRLTLSQMKQLWDLLSSTEERNVLIGWMSGAASQQLERKLYPAFDVNIRQAIFEGMICKQLYADPKACTTNAYECFRNLFISVNQECTPQKISNIYSTDNSMDVYDLDLSGIDVLWKVTIEGNEGCYKNAASLLLSLYRNIKNFDESTHTQFLNRCFEELCKKDDNNDSNNKSEDQRVKEHSRIIFLLKKFVSQCGSGTSLAHQVRGRGSPFKLTIKVRKIQSSNSQYRLNSQQQGNQRNLEQTSYKVHTNMTINSLVNFISNKYNHNANNVKLINSINSNNSSRLDLRNKRKTLNQVGLTDGDEVSAILTSPNYGGMNVSDDDDDNQDSPGDLIATSSKYIEILFQLLGTTEDDQLRGAIWQFLMDLPTHEEILTSVEAKTMEMNDNTWKTLLIDGSVYRAIYCLQVIDSCLVPSESKTAEELGQWRERFIASNGFKYVLDFLKKDANIVPALGHSIAIRILKFCLLGFPDNHVLSESAELTIKNTVNLDEVIDQMIDVIASSVKAQSNPVNNFGGINQVQFLIDTLEILQFILKQGNGEMQMEKLFASNELEFLIQNVILRYKSKKVRERAAALILQMSEKESFFPRIFDLLHTALSQVNGDVGTCPQFFTMFEELTEKLNLDMLAKVVHYLVSSLKSYPNDEKPYLSQYSGNINTGFKHSFSISCLKLFAKLIEKQPTAYKFVIENEPEIVEKLYSKYLFSVPTIDAKDAWPLCRLPITRHNAFKLLQQLVKVDPAGLSKIVQLAGKFKNSVRADKIGWAYEPDVDKKESRYVGLKNQGCTCYMNAVLQQLYLIKEIREGVLNAPVKNLRNNEYEIIDLSTVDPKSLVGKKVNVQWDSSKWYKGEVTSYDLSSEMHTITYGDGDVAEFRLSEGRPPHKELPGRVALQPGPPSKEEAAAELLVQSQSVFRFLKDSQMRYYDAKKFVDSCMALKMQHNPYHQNDSDEFLTKLLDMIEYSQKGESKEFPLSLKWLKECFSGNTVMQKIPKPEKKCVLKNKPGNIEYEACAHGTREQKADMICIKLPMPKKPDIEDALEKYIESEMLDGDNKVDCSACKEFMEDNNLTEALEQKAYKQPTLSRACFGDLPNLFVIALNRFELDYETWETVKRNDRVEFPMVLNMEPYTKEYIEANEKDQESKDKSKTIESSPSRISRADSNDFSAVNNKYAYRLRGVVIHKGIAQGGHYYSLGRVPDNDDDGGDGKWYKFDDELITPFPVEKLGDEAFGGYETRSYGRSQWNGNGMQEHRIEKMHNATILFYERIQKQEVPQNYVQDGSGMQDALNEVVAKPSSSEQEVWDANSSHIRNSYLFENYYSNFLLKMCMNAPTETNSEYAAPIPGNNNIVSANSLATVGMRHFLDVILHTRNKNNVGKWHLALRRHLNKNVLASTWFLSCLAQGEWLSEILLGCEHGTSREMLVSLVGSSIRALSPYENNIIATKENIGTWTCKLAEKMMNLLKLAAKNAERFDEFFLLLRDLAAEKNVRDYLLRNTGVSKLINLLLNDMSPPFLQAACGEIKNVGKTHSSNVNFANVIDTIAVLVGVLNCKRDPFVDENELRLSPNASKAFSDLFDEFAPSGGMSMDEFIKFCIACGAGKPDLRNHGIRTEKVKEIFNGEELTEDGKMPKSSFQHFYMETWKTSQGTAWRDLKKLKFSDDLKFRGNPTSAEYGELDLKSALTETCLQAFTSKIFQQKLFKESRECRMNVPMLLESSYATGDITSSHQLLKVILRTLTSSSNVDAYNEMLDSALVILKHILEVKDEGQISRLQLTFLHEDFGFLNFAKKLVINSENSNNNNNNIQNSRKVPWSVICSIYRFMMMCDVAREYLTSIKDQWSWIVKWSKNYYITFDNGGASKIVAELKKKEVKINEMAKIAGMPTLAEDILAYKNARVTVSGAGFTHVNGEYVFNGFFNGVPKYTFTTMIHNNGEDEEFKFTLFRCRLRSGLLNWYLSQMHPSQPGTEKDIDYYLVKSKSVSPPTKPKWNQTGKGQNPPPRIACSGIPSGIFDGKENDFEIPPAPQARSNNNSRSNRSNNNNNNNNNNYPPPDYDGETFDDISDVNEEEEKNPNDNNDTSNYEVI